MTDPRFSLKGARMSDEYTTGVFDQGDDLNDQATHPLTDEMIEKLVENIYETDFNDCDECEDNLFARAAYDKGAADKLEQVLEWLKATKSTVKLCPSVLAVQLEQAMRPQEDWFEAGIPGSFRREDN